MSKKIAFITSSPTIINSFLKNHIKELAGHFEVYIISNVKGEGEKSSLSYSGREDVYSELKNYAKIIHLKITRRISPLNDLKIIYRLFQLFKKERFYSVHSITSKVGIQAMIAGKLAKISFRLHTYTGQVWVTQKGIVKHFFKLMDKWIARLSTNLYSDSYTQMKFLVSEKVMNAQKIKVLGRGSISGVDLKRFKPDAHSRSLIRKKYEISDNELVFLLLCRITKEKGVLDLAQAFTKLANEISCTVMIVGPDEENLREEILNLINIKHHNRVYFHDYTYAHEDFLNAADILCLPSYREGFGSIIIDAAAVGVPCIGSNIYGISEAIVDGTTGLLHQVGNVPDLYLKMKMLATNSPLLEKLGSNALRRVQNEFSMERITEEWVKE